MPRFEVTSIDGNIGSGKSTVLEELKQRGYFVFEEDLNNWGTLLEKFYANPKRWMCSLQIKILHDILFFFILFY
jgi:deoxyadenosine/deoxycytidine kinase